MSKNWILAAALTVASVLLPASSQAGVLLSFDADGAGGAASRSDFAGFDWVPGNALADGGNRAVANFLSGSGSTEFNLFYQARLSVLQYDAEELQAPVGREFTIVAGFREKVLNVDFSVPGTVTATFGLVNSAPNFLEIWTGAVNANDLLGTGFNDGTRILAANINGVDQSDFSATVGLGPTAPTQRFDNRGADNYSGIRTVVGNGKTGLNATVTTFDANYFTGFSLAGLNVTFELFADFPTNLTVPFEAVNPSSQFVKAGGGAAPVVDGAGASTWSGAPFTSTVLSNSSIGLVNGAFTGQGGPDVQFQADASTTFDLVAIPEPASVAVWGIGASLALLVGRRRAAKRA
jgi:hypothetical protein